MNTEKKPEQPNRPERFTFAKNQRLLKNAQFKAVLARRLRASDRLLILYMAPNQAGRPRLGISIAKKLGKAVVRNSLKRYIREAFRLNQHQIPQNFDYLVMISPDLVSHLKSAPNRDILKKFALRDFAGSFKTLTAKIGHPQQ